MSLRQVFTDRGSNNLVSLRPNYFVSIGYLKTGTERGFKAVQALNPPGSTIISIGHHGSRSFDFCALPLAQTSGINRTPTRYTK